MTHVQRLSARLDELASSLHRAGVTGEDGRRLLEVSALATLKAVELELLGAGRNAPRAAAPPPAPGLPDQLARAA